MNEYLNSLSGLDRAFFVCAFAGGLFFLARMALTVFLGDHGGHVHADGAMGGDVHDAGGHSDDSSHSDAGMRVLTLQGLTAFFIIFGLMGLTLHRGGGMGALFSLSLALVAAFLMMLLVAKIFQVMTRLQCSGNLNIYYSLGEVGTIYLTIPEGGMGQVEVCIQNRLRVMDAIAEDSKPIPTGERVQVINVFDGNKLVVRKAGDASLLV